MPMYANIGGGAKQLTSLYINKDGTRKSISNAYANINAISKEIFAQLYSWIRYTYYGSSTQEQYPKIETWSDDSDGGDAGLYAGLNNGLYIATSYTINESTKKISLVNPKFLCSKSSATLHYDYQDYPYQYLSTITTVPQWTLMDTNYRGLKELDYSADNLFQRAYGYRISDVLVNPIEVRYTGAIRNGDVRLMEYQSKTIVYSSNKNEYKSSNMTNLGSNFYLDWYYSSAGTHYYYKKLF